MAEILEKLYRRNRLGHEQGLEQNGLDIFRHDRCSVDGFPQQVTTTQNPENMLETIPANDEACMLR